MGLELIFSGVGTAVGLFTLVYICFRNFKTDLFERLDKLDKKIDKVEINLLGRIDRLDEKLTDVDRRLCRMEGAMSSKECCMLKDSRLNTRAE